jgi:hypothetical protein
VGKPRPSSAAAGEPQAAAHRKGMVESGPAASDGEGPRLMGFVCGASILMGIRTGGETAKARTASEPTSVEKQASDKACKEGA